jgi:uncharacterized protein
MKFIADVMLGKLAKYLRICGYDVAYFRDIDDTSLIDKALKDARILLTRDRLMMQRKEIRDEVIHCCYIKSKSIKLQLLQLKDDLDLKLKLKLLRCVKCNRLLSKTIKSEARDHVPRYVFETQKIFYTCTHCNKFYWDGTHKKNMEKFLKENIYD